MMIFSKGIMKFMILALVSGMVFLACDDDDDTNIGGTDGTYNVDDGYYMVLDGEDPDFDGALRSETVEAEGFSSQERNGYFANYLYLESGDYNLFNVEDKELAASIGGAASTEMDEGSGCDYNSYTVVSAADDGEAFNVANAGLYKVIYDQATSEILLYKIESPGIIGSATEGGWGSDQILTGTVDANGGSWSLEGAILRQGEWKIRFNCRWSIDRRIDPEAGFDADNGYQAFTNFGGSLDNLLTGNDGSNMTIAEGDDAEYTVNIDWVPIDGFTASITRTGDAPEITFVPEENQWAITGDATVNGWADDDPSNDPIGVDIDLNYEGFDMGTYTWMSNGTIALSEGAFKFRTNDSWDVNIGWNELTLEGDIDGFQDSDGNVGVTAAGAGDYEISLYTSDEGANYTASFAKQ